MSKFSLVSGSEVLPSIKDESALEEGLCEDEDTEESIVFEVSLLDLLWFVEPDELEPAE